MIFPIQSEQYLTTILIFIFQKLVLLSQLVLRNLGYWSQDDSESQKHLSLSEVVVDVLPMKVYSSSTVMYSLKTPPDNQK